MIVSKTLLQKIHLISNKKLIKNVFNYSDIKTELSHYKHLNINNCTLEDILVDIYDHNKTENSLNSTETKFIGLGLLDFISEKIYLISNSISLNKLAAIPEINYLSVDDSYNKALYYFEAKLEDALMWRSNLLHVGDKDGSTNCFRWINGIHDGFPTVYVDIFSSTAIITTTNHLFGEVFFPIIKKVAEKHNFKIYLRYRDTLEKVNCNYEDKVNKTEVSVQVNFKICDVIYEYGHDTIQLKNRLLWNSFESIILKFKFEEIYDSKHIFLPRFIPNNHHILSIASDGAILTAIALKHQLNVVTVCCNALDNGVYSKLLHNSSLSWVNLNSKI